MELHSDGVYTQEKIDYVNSIEEKDLRACLLDHISKINPSLPMALNRIRKELDLSKSEGSYYCSLQSKIAMAFKHEFYSECGKTINVSTEDINRIANNAAKLFLDQLIG